ncbi:MAG: hypothetical protein HFG22_14115 [Lachnospiraceae bacterium]|nr:hypothetical protein [Lachnospiraceae bacterium]
MNYAWEAALSADRMGICRETLRYTPVRDGSPYTEVVLEDLNAQEVQGRKVEVNPLYRFARELAALFDQDLTGLEQTRGIFFDVFMQYTVQQDLRQGLSRQEYILRFLLSDLLEGVCGSSAAHAVRGFAKEKLRQLLRLIRKLYQCGSSLYLFKEVMRCMYPDSFVYVSNEAARQILIYVGEKETKGERERLVFLQDMFLPIDHQVYLFWEHHFGIIGVEETMVVDEVVLF